MINKYVHTDGKELGALLIISHGLLHFVEGKNVFIRKRSFVVPFCIDIIFKQMCVCVCVCLPKYAHSMVSPRRMSIQRRSALAYREGKDIRGIHDIHDFIFIYSCQKCILISLFIIAFEYMQRYDISWQHCLVVTWFLMLG
jgi:hypothetical protein